MAQVPYPMPAPSPATRPRAPGPGLRVSLSLMALGAVIGIASVIAIVVPLVGTFTSTVYAVPGDIHLHLKHARYTVYEQSGSRSAFGVRPGVTTIDPSQVAVTAPTGERVYVFQDTHTETITRGSYVYTGAVQFDTSVAGDYDVRLSTRRATSVVIARSVADAIRSVLVWVGTGAIGGLLLVTGLVLAIVGATRRGRARRAMQVGYGQGGWGQPGWGQPGWGQPGWGQPGWGQPGWGQPPQYGPPPSPGPTPDDPWAAPPSG